MKRRLHLSPQEQEEKEEAQLAALIGLTPWSWSAIYTPDMTDSAGPLVQSSLAEVLLVIGSGCPNAGKQRA